MVANSIFVDCRKLCPKAQFLFVQAEDLSLLRDVDRCCKEIGRLEGQETASEGGPARIDLLVMSQALLHFGARQGRFIVILLKCTLSKAYQC